MAQAVPILAYRWTQNLHAHFNTGYLLTFPKLNQNIMYGVYCDILSKDGASHMNARATL